MLHLPVFAWLLFLVFRCGVSVGEQRGWGAVGNKTPTPRGRHLTPAYSKRLRVMRSSSCILWVCLSRMQTHVRARCRPHAGHQGRSGGLGGTR